jgi:hypothetical protein
MLYRGEREQCNLLFPTYVFQKSSEKELFYKGSVKIGFFFWNLFVCVDDKLFHISVIKIAYGGRMAT